jgi:hypothetical protein
MIKEGVNTERGQVLIIMVFGMIVLLIVAGLAIDGGTVFMERRHTQNAADAAALAGTRKLAEAICDHSAADDAAILAEVVDFVARNRVGDPANSVRADYVDGTTSVLGPVGGGTIPVGATGISATVGIERSTYFMSLIGIDTSAASAHATAMTGPPIYAGGLRPFGFPYDRMSQLDEGDWAKIRFDADGGEIEWSNYITPTQHKGWMNLAYMWNAGEQPAGFPRAIDWGADANTIEEWMANGWPGHEVYPDGLWAEGAHNGDFIHAKPGTQASTICSAPEGEIFPVPIYDAFPDCFTEIDTAKPACPPQGSSYMYHIVGIASVRITGCEKAPEKEITVVIEDMIYAEGIPDISGGMGFGEAGACPLDSQVVTLWE